MQERKGIGQRVLRHVEVYKVLFKKSFIPLFNTSFTKFLPKKFNIYIYIYIYIYIEKMLLCLHENIYPISHTNTHTHTHTHFYIYGASLKLVDKFTFLGSSVSSTEDDIDTRLTKAWTAIDRLSIIWKSDLTDKMKRSFFQAAVVSILLYGCTTWTLTKRLEKKLNGNYTRMLRAILNKSW